MGNRKMVIGGYDTATEMWTLASCVLTKGEQMQSIVDVPGRYAPLDLSTYLTDGQPYYGTAILEATLESSAGTRQSRQVRIDDMVNALDGKRWSIVHPDHASAYLIGRVQIYPQYNDLAHCAVRLNAVCEPWYYAADETTVQLTASATEQTAQIVVSGGKPVVPVVVISAAGEVTLQYGASTWTLAEGEHILPDLYLTPGTHELVYSGTGTVSLTYREAVLAA